jgi:hypothetical protein
MVYSSICGYLQKICTSWRRLIRATKYKIKADFPLGNRSIAEKLIEVKYFSLKSDFYSYKKML